MEGSEDGGGGHRREVRELELVGRVVVELRPVRGGGHEGVGRPAVPAELGVRPVCGRNERQP